MDNGTPTPGPGILCPGGSAHLVGLRPPPRAPCPGGSAYLVGLRDPKPHRGTGHALSGVCTEHNLESRRGRQRQQDAAEATTPAGPPPHTGDRCSGCGRPLPQV